MEKISIITPVYNTVLQYFKRCKQSVLYSDYDNIEWILVDDGSELEYQKKVEEICGDSDHIIVVHTKNAGPSSARNVGLKHATGQYVTFIDSDDFISSDYLSSMVEAIDKSGADFACSSMQRVNDLEEPLLWADKTTNLHNFTLELNQTKKQAFLKQMWTGKGMELPYANDEVWIPICVAGKMYKKDILLNTRFDERIRHGEDQLFFAHVVTNAKRIAFVNEGMYYYRVNSDSITQSYDRSILNDYKVYLEGIHDHLAFDESAYLKKGILSIKEILTSAYNKLPKKKCIEEYDMILNTEFISQIIQDYIIHENANFYEKIYSWLLKIRAKKAIYILRWIADMRITLKQKRV